MTSSLQAIRGMNDVLPEQMALWRAFGATVEAWLERELLGPGQERKRAAHVLEDSEPAGGPKDAVRFLQRGLGFGDGAEDKGEDDPVERGVLERQGLGARDDQPGPGAAPCGEGEGRCVRVDCGDACARGMVGELAPCAHPDLEHRFVDRRPGGGRASRVLRERAALRPGVLGPAVDRQ